MNWLEYNEKKRGQGCKIKTPDFIFKSQME